MPLIKEQDYLLTGEGHISPQARVEAGEITEEGIQRFVEALNNDDYYVEIDPACIPEDCVDGRFRKDGKPRTGAEAAGGTFTAVVADALTNGSYRRVGEAAADHAKRVFGVFKRLGKKIGGHDDDKAAGSNCGCGAQDKFDSSDPQAPSVLEYITRRGKDIQTALGDLGVDVGDELNDAIVAQAGMLRKERYATNGAELRDVTKKVGGEDAVITLTGPHNEVVVNINTRVGKTLNRQKLLEEFGEAYQAFNVDVWAIQNATDAISLTVKEKQEKLVAALYYNVATASVLADKSLRINA